MIELDFFNDSFSQEIHIKRLTKDISIKYSITVNNFQISDIGQQSTALLPDYFYIN